MDSPEGKGYPPEYVIGKRRPFGGGSCAFAPERFPLL